MTGTPCLGDFLGAIFVRVFGGRFFGVARFDAFLRAGLAVAFPRFEAFLRVARRFFALAMAVPCEVCPGEPTSKQSNPANIIPPQLAAPLLSTSAVGPISDIDGRASDVHWVPIGDVALGDGALLDGPLTKT